MEKLTVGLLEENCYVIGDELTKKTIVIDPGDEADRIIGLIRDNAFDVGAIICTHAHFDHIGAAGDIKKATGAGILIHRDDFELYRNASDQAAFWGYEIGELPEPDGFIGEGNDVRVGSLKLRVLHTPGHSPGGICLYGKGIVITGDTLFQGSVGRTDFYGGDIGKLRVSFRRLLELPENTAVLPGHGPETTIEREKRENLFLGQ